MSLGEESEKLEFLNKRLKTFMETKRKTEQRNTEFVIKIKRSEERFEEERTAFESKLFEAELENGKLHIQIEELERIIQDLKEKLETVNASVEDKLQQKIKLLKEELVMLRMIRTEEQAEVRIVHNDYSMPDSSEPNDVDELRKEFEMNITKCREEMKEKYEEELKTLHIRNSELQEEQKKIVEETVKLRNEISIYTKILHCDEESGSEVVEGTPPPVESEQVITITKHRSESSAELRERSTSHVNISENGFQQSEFSSSHLHQTQHDDITQHTIVDQASDPDTKIEEVVASEDDINDIVSQFATSMGLTELSGQPNEEGGTEPLDEPDEEDADNDAVPSSTGSDILAEY